MHTRRVSFVITAALLGIALASTAAGQSATYLSVIMPTPTYANREEPVSFVVRALNHLSQPMPDYRGTISFTPGDPSVELPASYTFTEADAGQHTFSATFHRGGQHTFSVTDGTAHGSEEVLVLCPTIFLTASNDGPVCPGDSATLSATTNATSPTFSWNRSKSGGAPPIEGQTVVLPPHQSYGSWHVLMSDAATGCYTVAGTEVAIEPAPHVDAPEASSGDFIATIADDPNGPWTDIFWTVDFGTLLSGQGTHTISVRPDPGRTVVYTNATATRPTGCRRLSSSGVTNIREAPPSAISSDAMVCPGAMERSASVADAGPTATYSWSISEGGFIVMGQNLRTVVYNAPAQSSVTLTVTVTKDAVSSTSSKTIPIAVVAASVVGNAQICAGESATIPVTLTGTPPFRIEWSDGVVQSDISSFSTSRSVSPDESATYSIASVSDASCSGTATGSATVDVAPVPEIVDHPDSQSVPRGQTATLLVDANGIDLRYDWYEMLPNGSAQLVASGPSPAFTTPPITKTTTYYVEVVSSCGTVKSDNAVVGVPGRRRSARH